MNKPSTVAVSFFSALVFQLPISAATLELEATPERVSFAAEGVSFRGSGPAAVVVVNGKPVTLELAPAGTASAAAPRDTPLGRAEAVRHSLRSREGHDVEWIVSRLANHPGFTLQVRLTNRGSEPLTLRELVLCGSGPDGFEAAGDKSQWWMGTIGTQDQFRHKYLTAGDLATDAARDYLDFMTLFTERGAKGLVVGAVGPAESEVRIRYTAKAGNAGLVVAADMTDIRVDPGETRQTDEVLFVAGPYDTAAGDLVRWVAATHGARKPRRPLSGWCSWYTGGPKINAARMEKIVAGATAMRDNIAIDVLQIDDGWQRRYGDWQADPVKFPDGMAPTARQIAAAGFIPGIWVAPVRVQVEGKETWLDPTDPGVRDFIRDSLRRLVEDGYRYFKLDFNYPELKGRHDPKKTSLQVKRDLFRLYRESVGDDVYINACNGTAAREAIGFADAARVGTDVFDWNPKRYIGCGMVNGIEAIGSAAIVNGIWHTNDPDCVKIQPIHAPVAERRTWFGFAGLGGGLVLCSDQLDNVRELTKPEVMRNMEVVLPPSPEKARIFDGNTDWWHRQFGFIAKRPWGTFGTVQLLNPDSAPAAIGLRGIPLGEIGKRFHLFSFWDSRYLGIADEDREVTDVPSHGTAIVRLTPLAAGDEPVLVGSDLHVSMGAAEIEALEKTPDGLTIVLVGDAGARAGHLFVHSARPLTVKSAVGCEATLTAEEGSIFKIAVRGRKRGAANRIELARGRPEAQEPVSGDAVIRAPAGASEIVITTTSRVAGAIHSLTWGGREFIDSFDHGRQLQSASNLDVDGTFHAETFNPTEAGSERDGAGPTSSSRLLRLSAADRELATVSRMAFWLQPGQQSGGYPAKNTTAVSDHVLTKHVRIGAPQLPLPARDHAIRHQVEFEVPENERHTKAAFESLTGYMPASFSRFEALRDDGSLAPLDDGPGEQQWPVVFSTAEGGHAMGAWSPDACQTTGKPPGYGRFRFEQARVTKWNCVFREAAPAGKHLGPGPYRYEIWVAVGTRDQVRDTLVQLQRHADQTGSP